MVAGGVICGVGMFNALMMSYTRLPIAMAADGMLPRVFLHRNRRGVPWVSVLVCGLGWALALNLPFERLISIDLILYGSSLILEFWRSSFCACASPSCRGPSAPATSALPACSPSAPPRSSPTRSTPRALKRSAIPERHSPTSRRWRSQPQWRCLDRRSTRSRLRSPAASRS